VQLGLDDVGVFECERVRQRRQTRFSHMIKDSAPLAGKAEFSHTPDEAGHGDYCVQH
jgi:hypothetical protein